MPGAPLGPGLVLPMLLPAAAWLIWRALRRNSLQRRLTMLFLLTNRTHKTLTPEQYGDLAALAKQFYASMPGRT